MTDEKKFSPNAKKSKTPSLFYNGVGFLTSLFILVLSIVIISSPALFVSLPFNASFLSLIALLLIPLRVLLKKWDSQEKPPFLWAQAIVYLLSAIGLPILILFLASASTVVPILMSLLAGGFLLFDGYALLKIKGIYNANKKEAQRQLDLILKETKRIASIPKITSIMLDKSEVELTECPKNREFHPEEKEKKIDITLGDLHGNFLKLTHCLVKEGVLELPLIERQHSTAQTYQKLVQIHKEIVKDGETLSFLQRYNDFKKNINVLTQPTYDLPESCLSYLQLNKDLWSYYVTTWRPYFIKQEDIETILQNINHIPDAPRFDDLKSYIGKSFTELEQFVDSHPSWRQYSFSISRQVSEIRRVNKSHPFTPADHARIFSHAEKIRFSHAEKIRDTFKEDVIQKRVKDNFKDFKDILSRSSTNTSQMRMLTLIGDEMADRCGNDEFMLEMLDTLDTKKVPYEILLSNHSSWFIEAYEQKFEEKFNPDIDNHNQGISIRNMLSAYAEGEHDQKREDLIKKINKCYTPHLKLLSYKLDPDSDHGIVIQTHAPVDIYRPFEETLTLLARKMGVVCKVETAQEKADAIDKINKAFQEKFVQKNLVHELFQAQAVKNITLLKKLYDPEAAQELTETLIDEQNNSYINQAELSEAEIRDIAKLFGIKESDDVKSMRSNINAEFQKQPKGDRKKWYQELIDCQKAVHALMWDRFPTASENCLGPFKHTHPITFIHGHTSTPHYKRTGYWADHPLAAFMRFENFKNVDGGLGKSLDFEGSHNNYNVALTSAHCFSKIADDKLSVTSVLASEKVDLDIEPQIRLPRRESWQVGGANCHFQPSQDMQPGVPLNASVARQNSSESVTGPSRQ